jgi:hypothetical protein
MQIEIFEHTLSDGQPAKFSIWYEMINGKCYYYAKAIGTDLDYYKNLSPQDQKQAFGINVTNGNGQTVYYSDPVKLKADLISMYGDVWLTSEI